MADTLLKLSGDLLPPYSTRGASQTLEPIDASANMRRTVNGSLKDISFDGFRKYKSSITATDQRVPALDGIWPGATLTVECVQELAYKTAGGTPKRPVVTGSSRVEGNYTYYRPILTMLVTGYTTNLDEWEATVGFTLNLEEV